MNGGLEESAATGRGIGKMADIASSGIDVDASDQCRFSAWFSVRSPDVRDIAEAMRRTDVTVSGDGATPEMRLATDDLHFDLTPIAADGLVALPSMRFDAPDELFRGASAVRIVPVVGQTGGDDPVHIVRAACRVALALAGMPGCVAIGWAAADSAMGRDYFRKTVGDWLAGGPFPALGLTSMTLDGEGAMVSRGLHPIMGQELRVLASPGQSPADRARIAIRMIDHLVRNGPLCEAEVVEIDGCGTFQVEPAGEVVNLRPLPFA